MFEITQKNFGKSVRVFEEVPQELADELYRTKQANIPEGLRFYPNQPVILCIHDKAKIPVIVSSDGNRFEYIENNVTFSKVKPRNLEQQMLFNFFLRDSIRVLVVTGKAGSGKTMCIASHVLEETQKKTRKLILSKPLEIVTKSKFWGTVPGDENEKFSPFLKSFLITFSTLMGGHKGASYLEEMLAKKDIEFLPLELMRGASLKKANVWFDEAQNLDCHEMETLGSRIDDDGNSRLFLSADLRQRDRDIEAHHTGLAKLITSKAFLTSPLTAHIDLVQNERGMISQLFFDVFGDGD